MKVFLAGATGRVAEYTIKNLVEAGHEVTAGARSPERVVKLDKVTAVKLDLHSGVKELEELVKGHHAIYFTAGSRGKDLLQTDAFGAVKLMQAAESAGVKRFIMLSSAFATIPEKWTNPKGGDLTNYNIAKFFADQWLINNVDLDYTIVQPGVLLEEDGSGKIAVNIEKTAPNSIENVAKTLVEVLDKENTFKKVIVMSDGEVPIKEAIESI